MILSVITPHADRPVALVLCEKWMTRQTRFPDEWILIDGGSRPSHAVLPDVCVYDPSPPGAKNFCRNLLTGLAMARGEVIAIVEDDDWYGEDYLAQSLAVIEEGAWIVGSSSQRYYNIAHRCWQVFKNRGASLCQTMFRHELIPLLTSAIWKCIDTGTYGVDASLWRDALQASLWAHNPEGPDQVVGIKGLPGTPGLGIGHRPNDSRPRWKDDPDGAKLREWIGVDAQCYMDLGVKVTP